jgi:glyoxylase-like metal-dependent hydrolase (beta-lactamase superfamily II)
MNPQRPKAAALPGPKRTPLRRPGNPCGSNRCRPNLIDTEGITVMTGPITRHRDIESLKTAARWPGADRNTTVILAARLAAARADGEGYRYFSGLADAQPGKALPLALAGFFQARLGEDADAALAKLDQAAATDLGPPQYFRGLALAGLPPDQRRAEQAVADLEFVLAVRDQFPAVLLRAAYHGLAAAHAVLGHDEQAAEAERKSGLGAAPADTRLMFGGFWATANDGFRFTSPRILRQEPGIQVAQGYDFGDLAFITTSGGVVAIDAGTTPERVKAVLGDLDPPADGAISHLILTHAHWDHIGGAGALRGPGTRVIAQAGFPGGLDRQQGNRPGFRYFTGTAGSLPPAVVPDQLISQPTPLAVGGTELVLYPAPGGETPDALMVHLPASDVLFAGDVLMPYLGQPFASEGSPEGLLQALAFIGSLRPRLLIHGHTTLTEQFTADAVTGLEAALTQLHGEVLDGIRDGRTLPDILQEASLPAVLREHPTAVVPYLVIRDHFTERLHHQRTGYWQPDLAGLEPATAAEHAAALDLLAGGREEQFATAAASLIGQGDHALALQIIQPGLLRHPASTSLAGLRRTALHRLMEANQQLDPFKFLIYAELAGAEIGPVE